MIGSHKIADYLGVIGINEKLNVKQKYESSSSYFILFLSSYIVKIDSYIDKFVTNLEIYIGNYNGELDKLEKENEKWINLDGAKNVWLKIFYNQKRPPLTHIEFLYLPIEGKKLVTFNNYLIIIS